ncbi:MAG: UDP-3-O-[3-hydroxymyristoyl] glucosamine N-acyltransferase [Pseudohongiellaceae bacterium]|jgi:UDP-3-O-[3-hydroxymyristoyl] glucosamine N-acyltransferase
MMNKVFTLKQLAEKVGGRVIGDENQLITGISTLQSADSTQISFLANPAYEKYLPDTKAAAVILTEEVAVKSTANILVHKQPYLAYASLSHLWDAFSCESFASSASDNKSVSIHASAIVHETAVISPGVTIKAGAVLESGVMIGEGSVIGSHCVLGADSIIGKGTLLHANVTIYHGVTVGDACILHSGVVIGSDGFGFAPHQGEWKKIAQLGGVLIGNNVEIGANTAIDRGALDNTIIESGVKLDNQIQIAHNVRVGENTAIAACSAIAGSTTIGKNCVIAGASGVAGHLTITDNVHITAMTMVIKSLKEPGIYSSGTGVQPNAKWRKSIARLRQLDKMAARVKALEKAINTKS